MKRFALVLSLFTVVTLGLILTNNRASANNIYTNRNDYTNVYKYIVSNRGNKMMHFHNFKRLGKIKPGYSILYNGIRFCYIQKMDGYVPINQLRRVKGHHKVLHINQKINFSRNK
ncbi:hypothetical protein [Apilactobacillus quenuiae]|uniref:hypothetical protein n=1 Tax=Apilactobacillus quenuiae TaxID=2008377 RepID=UPI000D020A3F|nr:hypothetical protein [Apilactobacillus quenuiae]